MITKVIENFKGRLTRDLIGDLNSGFAKYTQTFGNDPFSNIKSLTWLEAATQIDSGGTVITDLIMAARPRLESGITYVYAIGHTGRLYKIQVNQPSTFNPNYDNPVLLTTLTINTPTFKYGSSIQFFGTTEKLYIGHDLGVTSVNYNGTGEAFVGTLSSYTANVPRPSTQFGAFSYWGNGSNLVEINASGTVTSYSKLSPALYAGTYIRDLELTPNGKYIGIIVSRLNSPDMTSTTQDTTSLAATDSYRFVWNGTDAGASGQETYTGYTISSSMTFGKHNYTMGYDLGGTAIYQAGDKFQSLPNSLVPNINAVMGTGNLFGFGSPETNASKLKINIMFYGQYDKEVPAGLYRFLRMAASSTETDIIQIPVCLIVSNLFYGSSSAGYTNNQVGSAKIYFSTLETSSAPTTQYRFYKFTTVPTGSGTAIGGVYETQNEVVVRLFRTIMKKRLVIPEVRIFGQPWVANNGFQIDLIGSGGTPITNSTKKFQTSDSTLTIGATLAKYNPNITPSYTIGVRITNLGIVNHTIEKIELDVSEVNA